MKKLRFNPDMFESCMTTDRYIPDVVALKAQRIYDIWFENEIMRMFLVDIPKEALYKIIKKSLLTEEDKIRLRKKFSK